MYKEIAIAGLSSLWVCAADAAQASAPVTLSSAVDARCFAGAAAQALASGQANWWQAQGYKSAAEWFAAALSYATVGLKADASFGVTPGMAVGGQDRLDFTANITGATLVLAATTTQNSATRFAKTWQDDWTYSPRYTGVSWVSGQAKAGKKAVGGGAATSAAGAGANVASTVSVTGLQISAFSNHLTLTAGAWGVANSGAYAGLFDRAAAAMGKKIGPAVALAASKAFAAAIANAVLYADVDTRYTALPGPLAVDGTRINLLCGAGVSASAEGFATPN